MFVIWILMKHINILSLFHFHAYDIFLSWPEASICLRVVCGGLSKEELLKKVLKTSF